ncbi:hypothetical protein DOZ80_10495 [Pseudomonas fluorescens]|uniref:Uncharacterized protein n=1 Tax=Pseudomonas fluorescens TaxID=294 RepID=A0A327N9H8_PSEFL|nr:hypothetical protein DOZ80_10495 [Pseudomonas fluorescens]
MSPMAQYVAKEGLANDWHHVHYGKVSQGGIGQVMVESTSSRGTGGATPATPLSDCRHLTHHPARQSLK